MRIGSSAARALAVLIAILLVGAFAVYVVRPHVEMYRFNQLTDHLSAGLSMEEVKQALGAEERRWERDLECVPCYPCTQSKQKGVVLFYRRGIGCGFDFGWYLYFDADGRLLEIEGAST